GYAAEMSSTYGEVPIIDDKYDIFCVRGPLTADLLRIPANKAITDGAMLIKNLPEFNYQSEHKYDCAFIPHKGSLDFYHYKSLCDQYNIHHISPEDTVENVVLQIKQSRKIICEAMHGAIIADTFRVPWHPVRFYNTVNEFKWLD